MAATLSQNQRTFIFENAKVQSCYLPCSFKERHEALAVEELRNFDEIAQSNEDCPKFFRVSWFAEENKRKDNFAKEDKDEDLSGLIYKTLTLDEHNEGFQKQIKGSLSPWKVCETPKRHKGGYLKTLSTWKDRVSAKGQLASKKGENKNERRLNSARIVFTQNDTRKCDLFYEKSAEKVTNGELNKEMSHSTDQTRLASPLKTLQFQLLSNPREYIRYYRECVTYFMIRQHVFQHVQFRVAKRPQQTTPSEKKSQSESKNTNQIFRLHLYQDTNLGVLRVGTCPSPRTDNSIPKKKENKISTQYPSGELKIDHESPKEVKKLEIASKQLEIGMTRTCTSKSASETSTAQNLNFCLRRYGKGRQPMHISKANAVGRLDDGIIAKKEGENNTKSTANTRIKKIELQVCHTPCGGTRAKRVNLNRPKARQTPAKTKKTVLVHSGNTVSSSNMTKMIFSDKEFLHITTAKPMSINPASQRGSSSKLFNSFQSTDLFQDNELNAIYPWVSAIPRGRLIDATQLNPYTEGVQYPDTSFQACITPSSYPSSSIALQLQSNVLQDSPVHQCTSEEKIHRIPSKPSVPRIGPFI